MAEEHQRKRVFFMVDYEKDGYLVFMVNLKDLSSDDHTSLPPVKMEMLPLPGPPFAFFQEPEFFRGDIAFAVSGTTIVGLGRKRLGFGHKRIGLGRKPKTLFQHENAE